jgi:hypothetical protein
METRKPIDTLQKPQRNKSEDEFGA